MGEKHLSTKKEGDTVKSQLPAEQRQVLGIPADAKAYLMGSVDKEYDTKQDKLLIEKDGKSYSIGLSKPITGRMSGESNIWADGDSLDAMTKDEKVRSQLAKALGIPQEPAAAAAAGAGETPPVNDGRGPTDAGRGEGDGRGKTDAGRGEGGGFMNWLGDNQGGLAAGLMAGLIGAAMGGGILGLILGLLAFALIGSMLDKNGAANKMMGKGEGQEQEKGRGQSLKKDGAPGPENAIDVKEGEKVQLVKEENGVKKYLSGQDKDGKFTYSDSPQDITIRLQDNEGKITGLVKGKASADGANFNISETTSMLPNGRLSPDSGKSYTSLTITKDGTVEMGGQSLQNARDAGVRARDAYAAPEPLKLQVAADKSATADLGATTIKVGDKDVNANIELQGRMSDDGKNVVFEKALFKDSKNEYVLDTNEKPIETALPDDRLKNLQVLEGNAVAPMSGDVKNGKKDIVEAATRKITARAQADMSEIKDMSDTLAVNDNKSAIIRGKFNNKLKALGATEVEASVMADEIANKYKDPEFLNKSAEERISAVTGTLKSETLDKLEAKVFAKNMDIAINGVRASDEVAAERTRSATENRENPVNYVEDPAKKSPLADFVNPRDYVTLPPATEGPKVPTDVGGPLAGSTGPAPTKEKGGR